MRRQELRDEAAETKRAVVGRQVHLGTGGAEVVGACGEGRGTYPVVQPYAADLSPGRMTGVTAGAEQVAHICQERRLADAAGDQRHVVQAGQVGEAVAEGPPDGEPVA